MFNFTYTPYMAQLPRKVVTVKKSRAMGCTVNIAENAINYIKDKRNNIDMPFAKSIVSIAVCSNLPVEN